MSTAPAGQDLQPPQRGPRRVAKAALRRLFVAGQRAGIDVLPRHFYSSIPAIHELRTSHGWRAARSMVGVDGMAAESQLSRLAEWFDARIAAMIAERHPHPPAVTQNGAEGYGPTESAMLFAFIAQERPRRVIQVGAGVSTAVILDAAERCGLDLEVVCVDPYPTAYLVGEAAAGRIELVRERAQDVALETLVDLDAGDLLFVDSTHTVKPDSEVNRLVLEVLPRLGAGVWVHFHDIWFPYDYPRDLLEDTLFFWNESVLLHAFLIGNAHYRVEVSGSWLHYTARDALAELVPDYRPEDDQDGLRLVGRPRGHFPGSTYLRAVAGSSRDE